MTSQPYFPVQMFQKVSFSWLKPFLSCTNHCYYYHYCHYHHHHHHYLYTELHDEDVLFTAIFLRTLRQILCAICCRFIPNCYSNFFLRGKGVGCGTLIRDANSSRRLSLCHKGGASGMILEVPWQGIVKCKPARHLC